MPIQTSYPFGYGSLLPGMAYDIRPSTNLTAVATVNIEFGTGLVHDPSANLTEGRIPVKLPSASSDVFAGVALFDHKQQRSSMSDTGLATLTATDGALYLAKEPITLRTQGSVIVYSEQAVEPGDPVFLRYTANGNLNPGNFRKDADTSRAVQLTNCRWIGNISAAGYVALEVNLP